MCRCVNVYSAGEIGEWMVVFLFCIQYTYTQEVIICGSAFMVTHFSFCCQLAYLSGISGSVCCAARDVAPVAGVAGWWCCGVGVRAARICDLSI